MELIIITREAMDLNLRGLLIRSSQLVLCPEEVSGYYGEDTDTTGLARALDSMLNESRKR
jgi:hypothetical protein